MNQPLTQTDWIAHYKAVRSRILKAALVKPPVTISEPKRAPVRGILPPPPVEEDLSPAAQFRAVCRQWGVPQFPMTTRRICASVCERTQTQWKEMKGPNRTPVFAAARHRLMHALHKGTPLSLPQIGRMLGNRDHSTILHGVRKHAERRLAERGR